MGGVISADGSTVLFNSDAATLVAGDTNGTWDGFAHDPATGETTRVSVASDGGQAGGAAYVTAVSGQGRYAVLQAEATNLVPGDTNAATDVFVHDRTTGETSRVSVAADGSEANGPSADGSISADGMLVAFTSEASNLVAGDTNGEWDVFVSDRGSGETTRVSVASDGIEANQSAWAPAISADGRYVAFESYATNLVPGDTNVMTDVFVHDRATGETTRASVATDGTDGDSESRLPAISADGRFVSFHSHAANLVLGDTNGTIDVFVHDRATGETTRASVATDGSQVNEVAHVSGLSADGRYVTFQSRATTLMAGEVGSSADVFVHDRTTGVTARVSVATDGSQANGESSVTQAAISAVGHRIVFSSTATNLAPGDPGSPNFLVTDVFLHTTATAGPAPPAQ